MIFWIPMRRVRPLFLPFFLCACLTACAQRPPLAVTSDPPPDKLHPAAMATVHIPSHGVDLDALMYIAQGAGPHPAVILLNGFPGNERNLDIAQAIRRDGWNVLTFNYRGSWGTPGVFSLMHCAEDASAALAFLRRPVYATQLHTNAKRIVLLGHSTGGFLAAYVAAHDPSVTAVGMISAAHLDAMGSLDGDASLLSSRPVLLVTSDDGFAGQAKALANALRQHGDTRITEKHFSTDHSYSANRIGLTIAVLDWLNSLP